MALSKNGKITFALASCLFLLGLLQVLAIMAMKEADKGSQVDLAFANRTWDSLQVPEKDPTAIGFESCWFDFFTEAGNDCELAALSIMISDYNLEDTHMTKVHRLDKSICPPIWDPAWASWAKENGMVKVWSWDLHMDNSQEWSKDVRFPSGTAYVQSDVPLWAASTCAKIHKFDPIYALVSFILVAAIISISACALCCYSCFCLQEQPKAITMDNISSVARVQDGGSVAKSRPLQIDQDA